MTGFEIYKDSENRWRWRFKFQDNIIAQTTDTYTTEYDCQIAIAAFKHLVPEAGIEVV